MKSKTTLLSKKDIKKLKKLYKQLEDLKKTLEEKKEEIDNTFQTEINTDLSSLSIYKGNK